MDYINKTLNPEDEQGDLFDIFKTEVKYRPRSEDSIEKHPKNNVYVRGVVPEKNFPQEGGKFKMYYHKVAGVLNYGDIMVERCNNVVVEGRCAYFEDDKSAYKYVLIPCRLN